MYPSQPELFAYLRDVAAKHDLGPKTRFGAALEEAVWDEKRQLWTVACKDGRRFEGRVLFSAMGPLHIPSIPKIDGQQNFSGAAFHSANWDFSTDLTGKRIAVIGTGASAIQFIPEIAKKAEKLVVFQRTPPWIMPKLDYEFTEKHKRRFRIPFVRNLFRKRLFLLHDIPRLRLPRQQARHRGGREDGPRPSPPSGPPTRPSARASRRTTASAASASSSATTTCAPLPAKKST